MHLERCQEDTVPLRVPELSILLNKKKSITAFAVEVPDVGEFEVLKNHLGLRVRAKPGDGAIASELGHLGVEFVGEDNSQGHALLGLICGIAKHQALQENSDIRTSFFL